MSNVPSIQEEMWASQKARLAQLRLRELVRRHGAGPKAVEIVDQFAQELFDDDVRLAELTEKNLIDFLFVCLRTREMQLREDRAALPKPLAWLFETIGWIIAYRQFAAYKELNRIVEGL